MGRGTLGSWDGSRLSGMMTGIQTSAGGHLKRLVLDGRAIGTRTGGTLVVGRDNGGRMGRISTLGSGSGITGGSLDGGLPLKTSLDALPTILKRVPVMLLDEQNPLSVHGSLLQTGDRITKETTKVVTILMPAITIVQVNSNHSSRDSGSLATKTRRKIARSSSSNSSNSNSNKIMTTMSMVMLLEVMLSGANGNMIVDGATMTLNSISTSRCSSIHLLLTSIA